MAARGSSRAFGYVSLFVGAVAALAAVRYFTAAPVAVAPPPPVTQAAPPASRPATVPATAPAPPSDLLDVLRIVDPDYPTTQPLEWPVEFADAARIETEQPMFIDLLGHLWIEQAQGISADALTKKPLRTRTHVVSKLPLGVHWRPGEDRPILFQHVRDPAGGGDVVVIERGRARQLRDSDERDRWRDAVPLGDDLVMPTPTGVARVDLKNYVVTRADLFPPDAAAGRNPPLIYSTGDRAYVWSPWENKRPGSDGVLLLTDDRAAAPVIVEGLAPKLVQLTPLGDGTILSVGTGRREGEDDNEGVIVKLTDAPGLARPPAPPAAALQPLIAKLTDAEPENREKAQRELEALGPAIYPTLQALHDDLAPEAQMRVERVLGQRFAPTLGGLSVLPGPVETVARFPGGGCALRLPGGGTFADEGGLAQPVVPATVVIRPGRFTERLPTAIEWALKGESKLQAVGNEYVIGDPTLGPRRWVGSKVHNLLGKAHRGYTELVGIDATGRWLFHDPARPGRTLVVDRTLPDVTPRLPAWTIAEVDRAGWSDAGLPMAVRNGQTFVLDESGWRRPRDGETLHTAAPPAAPASAPDGTTFTTDGKQLIVTPPGAAALLFDLPAAPATPPVIVYAAGRLFVQTEPGKLLRYRPTPDAARPLTLEATFDKQIPLEVPDRLWLDPAGRLVFATKTSLTLTFPDGRVPPALTNQVLIRGDREVED
ncbi:MAG TPA: hypothetical protein VF624_15360 [Tepidisphaeraceae bacterium]|jgi:hypothetical protein